MAPALIALSHTDGRTTVTGVHGRVRGYVEYFCPHRWMVADHQGVIVSWASTLPGAIEHFTDTEVSATASEA